MPTNTKSTPKAASKTSTKKSTPQPSMVSKVRSFVEASGTKGVTALQIAGHLNLVNDKMEKTDRSKALKKVRVLARKVVGGASQTRDGRSAIYTINS